MAERVGLAARPYPAYLKTRHWRELRSRTLGRWNGMCENCGLEPATEVHHRTYERLGCESPRDLAPLCCACHALEHPGTDIVARAPGKSSRRP